MKVSIAGISFNLERFPAAFRAILRFALPIGIVVGVVAAALGLLPPWPAVAALAIGLMATVGLLAGEKWEYACAAAVLFAAVAVVLSVWYLKPVVIVRAADASDTVHDSYLGICAGDDEQGEITFRNILVATGEFTIQQGVSARLYHVKDGDWYAINSVSSGRSFNQIGAPVREEMVFTYALGDRETPEGRVTQLGAHGQSAGSSSTPQTVSNVHPQETRTLPGGFLRNVRRIVYVEGDRGFTVDYGMTVESFARENTKGNYLVVEMKVR